MGRFKTQRTKEILQAKKKAKRERDEIKKGDEILKGLQDKLAKSNKKHERIVDFTGNQTTTVDVRRNIPQKIG